jgi:hypothetical protein
MMHVSEIIGECENLGIVLGVEEGRLRFTGPKGIMTSELRGKIAHQKKEVIEYLQKEFFDSFIQGAITQLNEAGLDLMKLPTEIRSASLNMEFELTEAANQGDVKAFKERVIRWRDMLLETRT